MDQPKPKKLREQLNEGLHLMGIAARCHTATIEPFLMSKPGGERYGAFALIAFLGMLLGAIQLNDVVLYRYAWLWLGVVLYRRIQVFLRWRRGEKSHSQYQGDPWLAELLGLGKFGRLSSVILCLGIGTACMPISENLGKLWLAGTASFLFLEGVNASLDQSRRQRIIDETIEMEWAAREARRP